MPALSAVLLTSSFQFSVLFFSISLTRPHQHYYSVLLVLICNSGHRTLPKIRISTFLVRSVQLRGKTEVILTLKMETRYPVEGPFPTMCNNCGVMTAWSGNTWKFCEQFLRFFFGKTTPYGKIFKILFWKFTWRHRLTLWCSNVVRFVRQEIGALFTGANQEQNVDCLSNCRYYTDHA